MNKMYNSTFFEIKELIIHIEKLNEAIDFYGVLQL